MMIFISKCNVKRSALLTSRFLALLHSLQFMGNFFHHGFLYPVFLYPILFQITNSIGLYCENPPSINRRLFPRDFLMKLMLRYAIQIFISYACLFLFFRLTINRIAPPEIISSNNRAVVFVESPVLTSSSLAMLLVGLLSVV